jgi:hypothetical protein
LLSGSVSPSNDWDGVDNLEWRESQQRGKNWKAMLNERRPNLELQTCNLLLPSKPFERVPILLDVCAKIVPITSAPGHLGKPTFVSAVFVPIVDLLRTLGVHLVVF